MEREQNDEDDAGRLIPMTKPVIDYAPSPPRFLRVRRWIKPLLLAAALLIILSIVAGLEVRHDVAWICASCASRYSQTDWIVGVTTSRSVNASALERWLIDHRHPHVHDWRNVKGTGVNVFGRSMSSGHGGAPPILFIAALLDNFVKRSTDEEVLQFVRVLTDGSESQQKQAIDSAGEKAFAR